MKKYFLICVVFYSINVSAAWIEASGKIAQIMIYPSTETVLVKLSSSGHPVDECSSKDHFAISKSASPEARARMYSYLLAAKMSDSTVTLAYNEAGGCEPWGSNSAAYRKITRIR